MPSPTAHEALRAATADCHQRLDALFGRFDLGSVAGYGQFLQAHAAAIWSLERALDEAGMVLQLADWPERQRGGVLRLDLQTMGLPLPSPQPFARLGDAGALWGAAYVLEGSRLGGAVLARRLGPGLPRRYLAGATPPGQWPRFLKQLDAALTTPALQDTAAAAAIRVFELFEQAAQQQPQVEPA